VIGVKKIRETKHPLSCSEAWGKIYIEPRGGATTRASYGGRPRSPWPRTRTPPLEDAGVGAEGIDADGGAVLHEGEAERRAEASWALSVLLLAQTRPNLSAPSLTRGGRSPPLLDAMTHLPPRRASSARRPGSPSPLAAASALRPPADLARAQGGNAMPPPASASPHRRLPTP
jgi:hypothetical protein